MQTDSLNATWCTFVWCVLRKFSSSRLASILNVSYVKVRIHCNPTRKYFTQLSLRAFFSMQMMISRARLSEWSLDQELADLSKPWHDSIHFSAPILDGTTDISSMSLRPSKEMDVYKYLVAQQYPTRTLQFCHHTCIPTVGSTLIVNDATSLTWRKLKRDLGVGACNGGNPTTLYAGGSYRNKMLCRNSCRSDHKFDTTCTQGV